MPKKKPAAQSAKVDRVDPNAVKKSRRPAKPEIVYPDYDDIFRPEDAIVREGPEVLQPSKLAYRDDARGLYLYHGDCLEVMDTLLAKHPGGVFDLIFADPPYFLSNGGITCHAGKMVKVDKGNWDKSRGPGLKLSQLQILRELQHGCGKPLLQTRTSVPSTAHFRQSNETRQRRD